MNTRPRRIVRVADSFFEQLDEQLGASPRAERGTVLHRLPGHGVAAVVDRFAIDFDALPELVEGLPASRMLIASGVLVRAFAVFGLLMADDSIELIGVELDMT